MAFGIESTSFDADGSVAVTSVSYAHVVTAANVLIGTVATGETSGGGQVSSMTYAAVGFTLVAQLDDNNWESTEIWKLTASVATGSNTFVVNFATDTQQAGTGVTGFTDASTTLGTPSTNAATSTNPNVTVVDSASGNIVVSVMATDGSASATTAGGTQLWEAEGVDADSDFSAQHQTATGASTACTWTNATSDSWVAVGVAIAAAAAGGGDERRGMRLTLLGVG